MAAVLPSLGTLGRTLLERDQRRAVHLLHLVTQLRPLFAGLSQLEHGLRWLDARDDHDVAVGGLFRAAADQVVSGTERLLAEPDVRIMDESHVLIEIEFLLLDFSADTHRVELWQALNDRERGREFDFATLRRRQEVRSRVPSGAAIFDAEEYRIHSRAVHPRPAGDDLLAPPDVVTGLLLDTGDLLHHASRVWTAGVALLGSSGDDFRSKPDFPPMEAVDEAQQMMDEASRQLGISPTSRSSSGDARSDVRSHMRFDPR